MPSSANVSLSAFEKELVTDANWILTKNSIIQKVFILFGELSEAYKTHAVVNQLPEEVLKTSPKISKGEYYEGLPYVMLDYPRCFSKEDVFAIRTFFWWGNYFSITLHLKGKYKKKYEAAIADAIQKDKINNVWINITEDEWLHHLNSSNMKIAEPDDANEIASKNLIKLTYKLDLKDWDNANEFLLKSFDHYLQMLVNYCSPNDETNL